MTLQVFCSPNWQTLEKKTIEAWEKSDGKGLIIVPSAMLRNWWLSRLAEEFGGVHGEVVVALERFAEQIAQRNTKNPFRLARQLELRLAAWDAFHKCDVPEHWCVSGVVDAFLDAVEELELHGLEPEQVAKRFHNDATIAKLTELWKHLREVLHERNLWTVGDVLRLGTEAVKCLRDNLPTEIIVYGFAALTDLRWKFLQALQNAGVQTVKFFVPNFSGNEQAYRYVQSLLQMLNSQGAKTCEIHDDDFPDELKCLVQSVFRWQRESETKRETDRILCIAASGEEQEVEMALRVLTQWRRKGELQRYSDALLFARSIDRYLPALEAVSARYRIPFVLLTEKGQPAHGLQQLFNALAEARLQGFDGEKLWQILPSPYLQVGGEPFLPAERHKETLQRIRQGIAEADIDRWTQRLAFDEKFVQKLRKFLQAVSQLPKEAPAKEHSRAWRKLLDEFVAPVNGNKEEREALRRVKETLNSLAMWSTKLRLDEVASLLIDACRLPVRILSDAIRVVTASEGRGLWSPVIVLLGLNDDEFPQTPSQFELLTDEHRKKLQRDFELLTPLKFRSNFLNAERMLFMETLGSSTGRLVLAYKRTDAEGKPKTASVFLSAVENALNASGWQWHRKERDLGDVLPRNLDEAIDQRDAEKAAIFSAFSKAQLAMCETTLTAQVLQDENFRLRLWTEWQRWEKSQQGSWDGNIPSLSSHIIERLQNKGLRVTALEDYGHCPYKFFARHILELQRPQDITYTVDHRTIGILWHEILAKFLQEWQRQGKLPEEEILSKISEGVVRDKLANYPDMVRELMRQQVLNMNQRVWQAEESERQKGWHPLMAEVPLQFEAEKLGDVPEMLKQVPISLKIDRIDENSKGQLRIADYKTGSAPISSEIKNGIALQLPLYTLAVQVSKEFSGKEVVEALFLKLLQFKKEEKGYSTACLLVDQPTKKTQSSLREMQRIAVDWAQKFLAAIANADFTLRPFDITRSCRGCDFKALCRQSKLRLTERKQQRSD